MRKLWTQEHIKKGFEKFITANGHLPTASEVDTFEHLPSSRYIQKRFGGLEKLRFELGYTDVHLGKGEFRRSIATEAGERSKMIIEDLQTRLYAQFGADNVDAEKTFLGKYRVNFYIHTPKGNFAIDIFYADTMRTLQSSVNIKMKKYINFPDPLYLVVANELLTQRELNAYTQRKKNPFPSCVKLLALKTFTKNLRSLKN